MYSEGFSTKIKNARKKWGFSQREVERETGIHQSTLARFETGKGEPNLEQLGILSDFYQVSIDWLLGTGNNHEPVIRKKEPIQSSHLKLFVSARDNIINENGNMYIELTPEQMKKIKEATE